MSTLFLQTIGFKKPGHERDTFLQLKRWGEGIMVLKLNQSDT